MSERNMYECKDCLNVVIITVINPKDDAIKYCNFCGHESLEVIESKDDN